MLQAEVFEWGNPIKIETSKVEVQNIIKKYVEQNQKEKLQNYNKKLEEKKQEKISEHTDITFVQNDLMWQDTQDNILKEFNILELKIYCRKLELASKKDWRVPSYKELLDLIDYEKQQPSSVEKLKNVTNKKYWSISQNLQDRTHYWYVNFKDGTSNAELKQIRNNIRCVRDISSKKGEI